VFITNPRGDNMHKTDLIDAVSKTTNMSKTDTGKVIDATLKTILTCLKKGDDVRLTGFGTFGTSKRKARKGRNPRTGAAIQIPASTVPKFSAGKELREAVNK
jgi:DNA-binding protein HU-beta